MVLKADQDVASGRVGESQSNGRVENAVQIVDGRIGEEIEHENQAKRPDIPVDGRGQQD